MPGKQDGWWNVVTRFSDLLARMRRMYKTEAVTYLLAAGFWFMAGLLFKYQAFYLIEHTLEQTRHLDEKDFLPRTDHFEWKVVATNEEADALEANGFEFRSYAYFFNARKALDKGAIASCIFIGRELAHIGWLAMTQEAKNSLNEPPIRVDFSKKESYSGGVWTNPKYRKLGLHTYGNLKRNLFLADTGATRMYGQIARRNTASLRVTTKFNPAVYGEGRLIKVLWWKWWRERALTKT